MSQSSVLLFVTFLLILYCQCAVATNTIHVGSCKICTHKTLHQARNYIRHLRLTQEKEISSTTLTVYIHQGMYAPLILDSDLDSNTHWYGEGENMPIISAGVTIPKSSWKYLNQNKSNILVADYVKLGLSYGGGLPLNGGSIDTCDQKTLKKAQLFHEPISSNMSQPNLARYPNKYNNNWNFMNAVGPLLKQDNKTIIGFVPQKNDLERINNWIQNEEDPHVHGYWSWDWADSIVSVNKTTNNGIEWSVSSDGPQIKKNARYFGLNILSELDTMGEYYVSRKDGLIYYYPHIPIDQWQSLPVLSVNESAVVIDNRKNVVLHGIQVAHATSTGISARNVQSINISNVHVNGHGAIGIDLLGSISTIESSNVSNVGCKGISVYCGDMYTMNSGQCVVKGNTITTFAQYKRTYQPGIHWGGVNNTFSYNHISNGAHNCILGGGNEAQQGGVNTIFEHNTLDK
jgi:hypothetical protein